MPTRIKLLGDKQRADQYRFIAYRKVLADALKLRSFQNLPIFRHQARIEGGGVIDVVCHHNFNEIAIYMPPLGRQQPEEQEMRGYTVCVVSIGQDDVGHHFFLWDPIAGTKVSGIQKAPTLNDLYTRFYPIKQDAIFIPKNSYGGHPEIVFSEDASFGAEGLSCSPPDYDDDSPDLSDECTDQKTNVYTHPEAGEVTDYYTLHKYYVVPDGDDEDWWLILEWTYDMPFCGHPNRSFYRCNLLDPVPLEARLTKDVCGADTFAVTIPHDYLALEKKTGSTTVIELYGVEDYIYETPAGKMRRIKGTAYENIPDMNEGQEIDETKLRFGLLPRYRDDATMFDQSLETAVSTDARMPFRQAKTWANWPDTETDARISTDLCSKQCQHGHCQAFLTSWVEWQGHTDTPQDLDSWQQAGSQDMIYICAASGASKPDSGFERHSTFEQEIANLVERATQDQRGQGVIDDERMYKGQLNLHFTDLRRIQQEQRERSMMMEFVRILNNARQKNGVPPLRWNFDLEDAARRHAIDLCVNKPVSGPDPHTGSDDSTIVERTWGAGFWDGQYFVNDDESSVGLGENVLWLTLGVEPNTPQRAFERWKASAPHWSNMIYDQFRETALDIRYKEADDGYTYAIWVQTFGYNWYNEN